MDDLAAAAMVGNLEAVRRLLDGGADVASRDENGLTPLHCAAGRGHVPVARLLIERGADVNAKNRYGATPLDMAGFTRQAAMREFLLACGVAATLHGLASQGDLARLRELLAGGADPAGRDEKGLSPLAHAVLGKHWDVARFLAQHGGGAGLAAMLGTIETDSPEAAADLLFDAVLPDAPSCSRDLVDRAFAQIAERWGSRGLVEADEPAQRARLLSNVQRTARTPGFRHFTIRLRPDLGCAELMAWSDGDGASACGWRTDNGILIAGNAAFA